MSSKIQNNKQKQKWEQKGKKKKARGAKISKKQS
jgi:hypothetical protein